MCETAVLYSFVKVHTESLIPNRHIVKWLIRDYMQLTLLQARSGSYIQIIRLDQMLP